MNRIIITVVALTCLAVSHATHAQTKAGSFMTGGSIGWSTYNTYGNTHDQKIFHAEPQIGYFITDNFLLGVRGTYSNQRSENEDYDVWMRNTTWNAGLFARYYHFISESNFAVFAQASADLGRRKYEYISGQYTQDNQYNTLNIHVSPGIAWFLSKHWALDLSMQGFHVSTEKQTSGPDEGKRSTSSGLNLNILSPSLGLRYHFNN